MKLEDAINKRRSIRKFSSRKIKFSYVLEAIDAAIKAPFAGNLNTLKFVIVEDPELIQALASHAQQDFIVDASYVVVVCSDYSKLESLYQNRATSYGKQHAGAAIENFLLRITDMKLASCWVGAFIENQVRIDLKIPENIEIEALLPVGYIKKPPRIKTPRKDSLEKAIRWNSWKVQKRPTGINDPRTW